MTYNQHFRVIDDAIGPQLWMHRRIVATATAPSIAKSYDPSGGGNKNDPVHSVVVRWTNDTPVTQLVYGMQTTGGRQITLQCRSRGYLSTAHGVQITAAGDPLPDSATIPLTEMSRLGTGVEMGLGGLLALGGAFGIAEYRTPSKTWPFMPVNPDRYVVQPGETITAVSAVSFISEFWENTMIEGGDSDTESRFVSGDLRLDLYATAAVTPPKPRLTPYVLGGGANIQHDHEVNIGPIDAVTEVNLPDGVEQGDILIAVVANQLGLASDIVPLEEGWTMLHSRGDGLKYIEDVHMRIFIRTATDDEPDTYSFANGLLAEEISAIIAVRDAQPFDEDGVNWFAASNLERHKKHENQIAPSMNLPGQLLILVSYLTHGLPQAPITQTAPTGATLLANFPANGSTMALAAITNPPRPTLDRQFTPSKDPAWITGHSITAAILIPGLQQT